MPSCPAAYVPRKRDPRLIALRPSSRWLCPDMPGHDGERMKRIAGIFSFTIVLLPSLNAQVAPQPRPPFRPRKASSRITAWWWRRSGAPPASASTSSSAAATRSTPRWRSASRWRSPIRAPAISAAAASWSIHLAKGNRDTAIDYRETAPAAATQTMFLDAAGNPDPKKSRDSGLGGRRARHRRRAGAGGARNTAPASSRSPS